MSSTDEQSKSYNNSHSKSGHEPTLGSQPIKAALKNAFFAPLVGALKEYAVFLLDSNGNVVTWNAGAERMKGYRAEEIIGKHYSCFSPQEEISQGIPEKRLQTAALQGEYQGEGWCVRKDGTRIWSDHLITSIHDEYGNVIGFVQFAREMTGLFKYKEELERRVRDRTAKLEASEKQFRTIIETANEGVWTIDEQSKITFSNPQMAQMLSCTVEEMIGCSLSDYFPPEEYIRLHQYNHRLHIQGIGGGEDYQLKRKDGKLIWAHLSASPILDDQGKYIGSLAMVTDITEKKQMSESLQETGERLAQATDAAQMGIWDWNVKSGQMIWTETMEKLFGFEPKTFPGTLESIRSRIHPDDRNMWQQLFEGVISKKASLNIDVRIIWPNQSVHWINIRGKAYYDSAGKVNRMSGTAINIDEQKTIHQELEKAIRAREEVLAVVSHDLKNPLGAISLNADLMIRMAASDEKGRNTKDQAERIKRAAMRMERLIQDLLDVTKIESGSFHLDRHIESPAGMIHEVTELLRPLAEQRNIHLYTEIDSDSPPVTCDHNRVLQVFSNLIGNAIKFTPSGGVVSVGTIQEEDNFLKFFVRDSGPGIRPEHLDKVFNRYWQAGQTAHKGVGLGLAISQGIVYAHGGKLWVESEYGKGATFYFTLPKVASQSQLSLRL